MPSRVRSRPAGWVSGSGMKPREPRRKVLIQARMRIEGVWADICIRDISSRGLLIQAAAAPERGSYIEIFRGPHVLVGRVVWKKDRRFGVQTQDRMDIEALVQQPLLSSPDRRVASTRQQLSDRRSCPAQSEAAGIERRIERSRRASAALQFGVLITCGVFAAMTAVSLVGKALSAPLESVSSHLLH